MKLLGRHMRPKRPPKKNPLVPMDFEPLGYERIHGSVAASEEEARASRERFYEQMRTLTSQKECIPSEKIHVWIPGQSGCRCKQQP